MTVSRRHGSLSPVLRYNDALAAITWLTDVAGFTPGFVLTTDDGAVEHAELWYGNGVVLVSTRQEFRPEKPCSTLAPRSWRSSSTTSSPTTTPR